MHFKISITLLQDPAINYIMFFISSVKHKSYNLGQNTSKIQLGIAELIHRFKSN